MTWVDGIEIGLVLSVYYWGYILGQLSGGIASDRFSIRSWSTVMFASWCVLTAFTGTCRSVATVCHRARTVRGRRRWVANPINKLENQWLLPNERGWVYGATVGFGYLGIIAGVVVVGWLISAVGMAGDVLRDRGVTILGVIVFWLLVYDHPVSIRGCHKQRKSSRRSDWPRTE